MHAPAWVTALVTICVSTVWTAALLIGFVQQNYTPLTVTTPVMLVLAGYAFGVKFINRQNGNGSK